MSYANPLHLIPKIRQLMARLVHGPTVRWSVQYHTPSEGLDSSGRRKVGFWDQKRELKEADLLTHFTGKPVRTASSYTGSVALCGTFADHTAKWCFIDCDNPEAVDVALNKLVPILDRYGIDWLWNHSGREDSPRGHLLFFVQCKVPLLKRLILYLFAEAGIDPYDKKYNFEIYPALREGGIIRLPGGFHLRDWKVFPVTRKGKTSNDPLFVLDSLCAMEILTEERILSILPADRSAHRDRKAVVRKGPIYYTPKHLPVPTEPPLPPMLRKIASECQAINTVLNEAVNEQLIELRGGMHHTAGLYLYNMSLYNDLTLSRRGKPVTDGEEWARKFFSLYRFRDYKSHNWKQDIRVAEPDRLFPSCKTWQRDFNLCDGCPFQHRPGFTSPKLLYKAEPIVSNIIDKRRLVTPEEIRATTFVTVKNRVKDLIATENRADILLASPQSAGKSRLVADLTAELVHQGRSILIAVPTGELALQYSTWLDERGVAHFIAMSHKNLFTKFNPGFECPSAEEIQAAAQLGVASYVYKKSYCEHCPVRDACPFPDQYTNLLDPRWRVVIIQHAHFRSPEAMHAILRRNYDVLFVDESFINDCLEQIWPTALECELLSQFRDGINWVPDLHRWMKSGGYPHGKAYPTEAQLLAIKQHFDDHQAPWRIPEYVRYYNREHFMDTSVGLFVFHEIPRAVPVRVFTDATPPVEMLQIILDNYAIESYGHDEVLDYRKINPANRIIQVLDGSVSKTALRGEWLGDDPNTSPEASGWSYNRLIEILEYIGDQARTKHLLKRILVTTYVEMEQLAREWLEANYPDIMDRVCINHMSVGTNAYEGFHVQYIVAGVYLNARQFLEEIYKLKVIANYWRRKNDQPEIENFYPYGVGNNASIDRISEAKKRIIAKGDEAFVVEYPQFRTYRPENPIARCVEDYMIAKSQQAGRIRWTGTQEERERWQAYLDNDIPPGVDLADYRPTAREIMIFGDRFNPSFLITDSVLEDDVLGYLRDSE